MDSRVIKTCLNAIFVYITKIRTLRFREKNKQKFDSAKAYSKKYY